MTKHILLLCLAALLPAMASAQADSLRAGARVRILAPTILPVPIAGRVTSRDAASLALRLDGSNRETLTIPFASITRMERSAGARHGAGAALGGLLGLVLGAASGAVVAMTSDDGALAPIGFGLGGLVGGTLIGAAAAPERWQPAPAGWPR